ncbi:MAG: hypothetical protein JWO15_94 [Sphingomonadales bacterium]|nr:hypothetical protein [Sphingomonadales bacterium]
MIADQPHSDVHARLKASPIHGVGVFAIRDIIVGTNVFENDRRAINWIDARVLDQGKLTDEERQLYLDFGVRKGALIGCPENFNLLGVGWYVNQPTPGETANLQATEQLDMIAVRDIAAGEELTISYAEFSEPLPQTGQ